MSRSLPSFLLALLLSSVALAAPAPPVPPPGAVAAASAQLEARDPAAGRAVAALRSRHPDDVGVAVLAIRWELQQGRREHALELAEALAKRAPGDAQVQFWLGNAYGQRIGEVGLLTQARYAPRIRAAYERALAIDPDLHEARLSLVEYHLRAPAIVGGDAGVAAGHQRELARRDPPRGHYARARIAEVGGDADAAAAAYLAAWKARPENARYRLAAGVALQAAARWDDAHAHFARWVDEDPAHAAAWYQLGRTAALGGGHLAEGAAAMRRYLALPAEADSPGPEHAWWRLGQIQARAGDRPAARTSLQRALAIDPDLEEARDALDAL
jgi:predicted Zn-dependent protease